MPAPVVCSCRRPRSSALCAPTLARSSRRAASSAPPWRPSRDGWLLVPGCRAWMGGEPCVRVRLGDACSRGQLSQEAAEAYAVSTLEGAVMLQLHRRRQGSRARCHVLLLRPRHQPRAAAAAMHHVTPDPREEGHRVRAPHQGRDPQRVGVTPEPFPPCNRDLAHAGLGGVAGHP